MASGKVETILIVEGDPAVAALEGAHLEAAGYPQASPPDRKQAYTLSNFFKARYGSEGWTCTDTPPAPGETPVGTLYINQRCAKLGKDNMRVVLETRFLRLPGQAEFSGGGKLTVGQFESSTRLELLRADIPFK